MIRSTDWLKASILVTLLAAGWAQADPISDTAAIPDPRRVITFDGYDGLMVGGPGQPLEVNVGTEVGDEVFLTTTPWAELGAIERDLGTNGIWGVGERFVASEFARTNGQIAFTFTNPVFAVGAFFNQFQVTGVTNSLTLLAYDLYGNTLETFSYSIDTDEFGYNEGQFLGFRRAQADIYGFGIANGAFVFDNLTYTAPVPEPGVVALMLAGLGILVGVMRRRGSGD